MAIIDLGELHGEVLVFGGNYSNLPATLALQAVASERGIPAQQVICTGDVVAYCAQPEETVSAVRDWGIPVVMGNCEESLGFDAPDCGCGFAEGSSCAVLANDWFSFSRGRVSAEHKAWMRALPRSLHFQFGGKRFQVVHGGIDAINRFIFASLPDAVFAQQFQQLPPDTADVVIGGHAGIPFGRRCEAHYWLNTGAIGMPANDGTADTWYLLLSLEQGAIKLRWQRLQYDVETTQRIMREQGLDNAYAAALATGLWPSLDVLPEFEKQQTGKALSLPNLLLDASR